jgi:hypothetical protein
MEITFGAVPFKDLIAPLVAIAAVTAGLVQYWLTSKREFIKPLREAQLKLYQEASSAAARVALLPRDSSNWRDSRNEFLRLYYGPLAMLEDFDHTGSDRLTVERAMMIFKSCLDREEKSPPQDSSLKDLSLALAHTCRESLGKSWGRKLKELSGSYQRIALEYEAGHASSRSGSANVMQTP